MIQVPPGLGKSHIIAGLVMNLDAFEKFVIVYSSAILLKAEADDVQRMREVSKRTIIAFHAGGEGEHIKHDRNTAILTDEADNQYFDRLNRFEAGLVIGLTATPLTEMESNEKVLLM